MQNKCWLFRDFKFKIESRDVGGSLGDVSIFLY